MIQHTYLVVDSLVSVLVRTCLLVGWSQIPVLTLLRVKVATVLILGAT